MPLPRHCEVARAHRCAAGPLARNEAPKGLWQSVFPYNTKTRRKEAVAFWRGRFVEILRVSALALIPAISANKDERTDYHAAVPAGSE